MSYSTELCNKNCVIKTSEMLIIWSAFYYNAGSDKPGRNDFKINKMGPGPIAKKRGDVEFVSTYWCSQSALIVSFEGRVYTNWTSSSINLVFQCNMVSLKLCKECLNVASFNILVSFLMKRWTLNMYETPWVIHLRSSPVLFVAPCVCD